MKFCGYCGASIPTDSAVSFCLECGKRLVEQGSSEAHEKPLERKQTSRRPVKQKTKTAPKKRKPVKTPVKSRSTLEKNTVTKVEPEAYYDGYYNDVETEDDGGISERMDPGLIKRLALVGGGALLIIALASLLMFFL